MITKVTQITKIILARDNRPHQTCKRRKELTALVMQADCTAPTTTAISAVGLPVSGFDLIGESRETGED